MYFEKLADLIQVRYSCTLVYEKYCSKHYHIGLRFL